MNKKIFKVIIILHLILLGGCSDQPNVDTTITPYSQTATPNVTPGTIKSLSVATSTQEQNKITETPPNQKETPTNLSRVETEEVPSLDVIYLFSRDLGGTYFFLNPFEKERKTWLEPEKIRNPQDNSSRLKIISFSQNRNQIAYQMTNGEVWISDLMISKSTKIYKMQSSDEFDMNLIWTPDDLNLIIDIIDPQKTDFIFNIPTGKLDTWESQCNLLVLSPRTKKLAVACWSKNKNKYTYLEWGGDVWLTSEPPDTIVLEFEPDEPKYEDPYLSMISLRSKYKSFSLYLVAGWSPDGKSVAYFDPNDSSGSLLISNIDGTLVNKILDKAYWQNPKDNSFDTLPGPPVQWSEDGRNILLFGKGTEKKPCPTTEPVFSSQSRVDNISNCWQVIDLEKSDIQWITSEIVSDNTIYYENAALSRDGNQLAINSFYPSGSKFQVIDLESNSVILSAPISISDFRWGKSK